MVLLSDHVRSLGFAQGCARCWADTGPRLPRCSRLKAISAFFVPRFPAALSWMEAGTIPVALQESGRAGRLELACSFRLIARQPDEMPEVYNHLRARLHAQATR